MTVHVIGDVHGNLSNLTTLLLNAQLMDKEQRWLGGTHKLWLMGDFFDRGPHGIGVVELLMRLQAQAADVGGEVRALLGNHEILFLAAHRFKDKRKFVGSWKRNGGQESDMLGATSRHIAWLRNLPALAIVEGRLFMHADAMFYLDYGLTMDAVNSAFSILLRSDDTEAWEEMIEAFSERLAFNSLEYGRANAIECMTHYGGRQIVHGHTPIQYLINMIKPQGPYIYTNDLCINVDGGMYMGAPGFVYKLPG